MELQEFIRCYLRFAHMNVRELVSEGARENPGFVMAFLRNPECRSWYIRQQLKAAGTDPGHFCCLELGLWNIEHHKKASRTRPGKNQDQLVTYWPELGGFGLQHPSNEFYIPFDFCPWCGKQLLQRDYFSGSGTV